MEEIVCNTLGLGPDPDVREFPIKEEQPEAEFVWTEEETELSNSLPRPDPLEPDEDVPGKKRKINVPEGLHNERKQDSAESDDHGRNSGFPPPALNNLPVTPIPIPVTKPEGDQDTDEEILQFPEGEAYTIGFGRIRFIRRIGSGIRKEEF